MNMKLACLFSAALVALATQSSSGQTRTVGLIKHVEARTSPGYTLLAPKHYGRTYLIDNYGQVINTWDSKYEPGQSAYLLANGHLLRAAMLPSSGSLGTGGGEGGRIEEYDWDGNLVWEFDYVSSTYAIHHDIKMLPNGNVIALLVERKTRAETLAAGFKSDLLQSDYLLPDAVVEIEPIRPQGGQIVWEWHVWDHLVQNYDSTKNNYGNSAAHPELVDPNASTRKIPAFWNHMNAIDYNAAFDQILLSVRGSSEVWVIDHSTTKTEAAGHTGGKYGKGGDLLYRWGNPQMYYAGTSSSQMLWEQHDAQWIEAGRTGAGDMLVFNNGVNRPGGNLSSADEFAPPVDASGNYAITSGSAYAPKQLTWTYAALTGSQWYESDISGAYRLPNGNTLICYGTHGVLVEVTQSGEIVWQYVNPVSNTGPMAQGATSGLDARGHNENAVFRVRRYPPDYAGLAGRTLTTKGVIEISDTSTTPTTPPTSQLPGSSKYPDMTLLPGGEFQMGDHAGFVDPQHTSDEIPIHRVSVDSFYIGKYDVTNTQYITFLNSAYAQGLIEVLGGIVYRKGSNDVYCDTSQSADYSSIGWDGRTFALADTRGTHPVVGIRWSGAAAYANWLSSQLGLAACYDTATWKCDFSRNGYRLPTEAEWEYAARGGQYNPYYVYPWGDAADAARANWPIDTSNPYRTGSYPWTTPVGFYNGTLRSKTDFAWPGSQTTYQTKDGSNAFGLYDMAGNVWQWVHDWYQTNYYSVSPYKNPTGPDTGSPMPDGLPYRGMRGGNWFNGEQTDPGHARVSNRDPGYYRGPQDPNHPYYHVGFRVARPTTYPTTMARLPGTGQTTHFTTTPGEDADYALDPPSLAANGDGTVTDLVTGLMWQQADGGEMTWENAGAYCKALSLGGHQDWRLPFAHEAFSILNHGTVNPALDTGFFAKSSAEYWWTADQRADDASRIWVTNAGGGIGPHPKSETIGAGGSKRMQVRCARSSISVSSLRGSYTDNGDGTVTDNHTGLMWQKADSGSTLSWEDALRYSEGLSLAGYSDWRLPNVKELQSINEERLASPSLDATYFSGVLASEYWSSTTLVNQPAEAWTVEFAYGIASYRTKTEAVRVRSVRGGFSRLAVVSAASYAAGVPLAPASIASAFNSASMPAAANAAMTLIDASGASYGVQLLAVSPGQINCLLPAGAAAGVASVLLTDSGKQVAAGVLSLERLSPGLFTANANGKGVAAAYAVTVSADGKQSAQLAFDQTAPAGSRSGIPIDVSRPGEQVYLILSGTGMRNSSQKPTATIGGAEVAAAGPVTPGDYPGLDQVTLGPLPQSLSGKGEAAIVLRIEGKTANTTTVTLK
jgi:uncharacterized protein (TIGR03437 family)